MRFPIKAEVTNRKVGDKIKFREKVNNTKLLNPYRTIHGTIVKESYEVNKHLYPCYDVRRDDNGKTQTLQVVEVDHPNTGGCRYPTYNPRQEQT